MAYRLTSPVGRHVASMVGECLKYWSCGDELQGGMFERLVFMLQASGSAYMWYV